ncbi:MAG: DUF4105 domain-containing protein [Cocleimonas sp.]|nr:DUF4105 domain-containing protein [Cocleimonas sp.]
MITNEKNLTFPFTLSVLCAILFFLLSLPRSVLSGENQQVLQTTLLKAEQLKLYNNKTWLRLLHLNKKGRLQQKSEIISPSFFLSNETSIPTISPKKELQATLTAFFQPRKKDPNQHAQCRFPARFYWLKQHLSVSLQSAPVINCDRLARWAKFSSLDSISLVLVGGYFGNPASTFGHLLVKLNNSKYKDSSGNLLDQSINYGAQVPDHEAIPVYIFKGLLGGYVSRFRDKAFYKQDRVYSRQELRDMWEYELNLTAGQQRFLVYHLWEVMGMKSTYYFLKKNCAYRVAELIELVTGELLTQSNQPWYLPITLFQDITDIKQSRYIKKITFLPSNQRKLYHQFDQLSAKDAQHVNTLLADSTPLNQEILNNIKPIKQAKMIDVMLAYYHYKLIDSSQDKDVLAALQKRKNHLLLLRLQLPIADKKQQKIAIPTITSPAVGSKPRLFSVGFGYQKKGHFLKIGLTGIHYDLLTKNYGTLKNSELKVFDLGLKSTKQQKLILDYFNLLRLQKLNTSPSTLYGEDTLSWRVALGINARNKQCNHCNGVYLLGGIGKAWQLSPRVLSYAMLEGRYHAAKDDVHISPVIGFITEPTSYLKTSLEIGVEKNVKTGKKEQRVIGETRYSFSKNNTVRLSYEAQEKSVSLSYYHHW